MPWSGILPGINNTRTRPIDILNAWSPVLWDLDYNDAKLLAGMDGAIFFVMRRRSCVIRMPGWSQKDIDAFKNMLMTVDYPLMRPYFPQANGNWGWGHHSLADRDSGLHRQPSPVRKCPSIISNTGR